MEEEKAKVVCPPYSQFDQPQSESGKQMIVLKPKTQKVLLVYAAVITTAFVVATILGSVYYANSLTNLTNENNVLVDNLREITVASTTQKVAVDTKNDVSIFYPQGPGVPNGTVAAIDYQRSITGIYDPQSQECYVTAGMSSGTPNAMALESEINSGQYQANANSATHVYYKKVDNVAVADHSVLPSPLQSICVGLPVYWLEQADAPTTGNTTSVTVSPLRKKRQTIAYQCYAGTLLTYPSYYCCRAEVCIYIGGNQWYCYLYCYFCRTYGGVGSLVYYSYSC